jgi:hypothetical protein
MLPGFHGCHCDGPVEVIVQANVYGFDVVSSQQVMVIGIQMGNIEPGRNALGEGLVDVYDSYDLCAGDILIGFEMLLSSLSRADQPDTDGLVF